MTLLDLVEADQAVHPGHAQVEHDQVGVGLRDEREHLLARARFADDLEPAVVFERAFDPGQDQAVIIRDDDFQHDFSLYRSNEGFP